MFEATPGQPPHQNTIGYLWRKACTAAKVSDVTLHDLRHYFASGLIAAGCDVVTVQRALGHAKATTTLGTYSHLWPTAEAAPGRRPASCCRRPLLDLLRTPCGLARGVTRSDLRKRGGFYTLKRNSTTSPSCMV